MTDDPSYRLFILEKFKGVEESLERIEKHLEKQNSSVAKLQDESNKRQEVVDDFRHLEKDFECVKQKVDKLDKDLLEVWFFKKYPKVFIGLLTILVAIALGMSTVGTIKTSVNNVIVKEIQQKFDDLELSYKILNAPTRGGTVCNDTIR